MAENLHEEDVLIKYLDGEMTEAEKRKFEAALEKDVALRQQLESLRLTKNAVQYYGLHQAVASVRSEWESMEHNKGSKVISMRKFLRPALTAAACLILLAAGIFGYQLYQLSPEKVYNESFVGYTVSATRGNAGLQTTIATAYQQKDFKKVVASNTATPQDKLLVGLSYMQLHNFLAAIQQFNTILNSNENAYKQDAEFYLALSYLRNKQYNEALQIFEQIRENPTHLYHDQVSAKTIRELKWLKWK